MFILLLSVNVGGFFLNRFRFEAQLSTSNTGYLYDIFKLFDTGCRLYCKICSWDTKFERKKKKKRILTRICSYIHCLHYALYVSPSGDIFDWQQTVEAMIHHRRTSGKTWCSQLHTEVPIKDSDLELWLTFLLWYFDMEIRPFSLCCLL